MGKKNLIYQGVPCEYVRLDENIEFFCARCNRRKISKKYARAVINGEEKKLCNACYGALLAKMSSVLIAGEILNAD